MDDLTQWYRAQLDEDERIAQATAWCWSAQIDNPWTARAPRDEEEGWTVWSKGSALMARGLEEADAQHIAEHDPARVLREIDAKRQMLADVLSEPHFMSADDHWNTCPAVVDEDGVPVCLDESRAPGPCECGRDARVARRLRLLALPYAVRPGYRDDWRP